MMPVKHLRVAPAESLADANEHDEAAAAPQRPEVRVLTGVLRGRRKKTAGGAHYFSFMGIPYAAAPVGEMRFKAPSPAVPWEGVRDAARAGYMCSQPLRVPPLLPSAWSWAHVVSTVKATLVGLMYSVQFLTSREDCLYANVYTPELPRPREDYHPRLPVMVLIHGGGFRIGDGVGIYGPDYLMEAGGLVFVTFNYRLGPFGFLATGTKEAPGNAGLKDQVMLLRWVRDNIAAFGGDPDLVTLYGESAGGVSAHLHTLSPLSRGLFHRVVMSSNMASPDWGVEDDPLKQARILAEALGIDEEDPDAMVRRLRSVPAWKITWRFKSMWEVFSPFFTFGLMFVPTIEPPLEGAFLHEDPVKILAEGRQYQVPAIVGGNSYEGAVLYLGLGDGTFGPKTRSQERRLLTKCARESPEVWVPRDLRVQLAEDRAGREALGRQILHHYYGAGGLGPDSFKDFINFFGDTNFSIPTLKMASLHTASLSCPVYQYYFTYQGDRGPFVDTLKLRDMEGAAHADDLGYFLRSPLLSCTYRAESRRDRKVRDHMTSLLANFVKTGNPTPPEWAKVHGVTWQPRSRTGELRYLEISDEPVMRRGIMCARWKFWEGVYKKYLNIDLF